MISKMEFPIRDFIREIKNALNTRLDILEGLININNKQTSSLTHTIDSMKIEELEKKIQQMQVNINELMSQKEELPSIIMKDISTPIIYTPTTPTFKVEERILPIHLNEEVEEKEVEEEEVEQIQEEVEEEVEQIQEEVEEEEVEEEVQERFTQFEHKGVVLYRDSENKVYQVDEDDELIDTPIGVWNEAKKKILRI